MELAVNRQRRDSVYRRFQSWRAFAARFAAFGPCWLPSTTPGSICSRPSAPVASACCSEFRALEWCAIAVAIAMVWTAEALNTAFEFLCDVASPEFHPLIQKAKDVAAAAVLLSAVGAAVIGLIVFVPHLLRIVG